MVDIKRTIAGVRLLADTDDKEKAAKVQKILDAVMKAHAEQKKARGGANWINSLFGGVGATVLLLALACGALAQPVPDESGPTRPVPEAKALRDAAEGAAGFMESLATQQRWQQETIARLQAEQTAFKAQIDRLATLAWVPWTPTTTLAAGTTYRLPDNQAIGIVVDKIGVTLVGGKDLYGVGKTPAITIRASFCELRGVNANKADAPAGTARLGLGEFIAVGSESRLTSPVIGTKIIGCTAGKVDAFVKAFPDCDGLLVKDCQTTSDLRADGVFSGGASGVTVLDCDLTAYNENTTRATVQRVTMPDGTLRVIVSKRMKVIGGRIANTGGKAAVDARNVEGFDVLDATLSASDLNSAVGIGNSSPGDPGPSGVRVERCRIPSGSLSVHHGRSIYLLNNVPQWGRRSENSFISLNAVPGTDLADVKVIGNAGPGANQKAMIGYGDPSRGAKRENIAGYEEHDNGWTAPATQPTTRPIQ